MDAADRDRVEWLRWQLNEAHVQIELCQLDQNHRETNSARRLALEIRKQYDEALAAIPDDDTADAGMSDEELVVQISVAIAEMPMQHVEALAEAVARRYGRSLLKVVGLE